MNGLEDKLLRNDRYTMEYTQGNKMNCTTYQSCDDKQRGAPCDIPWNMQYLHTLDKIISGTGSTKRWNTNI